ncbi:MAG: cation:dicarboxylase symporter family transporter [Bacteroidota bacterium]|nr:cation:dicarboxylase symporter family transporter [Bacteroidota bacterium]
MADTFENKKAWWRISLTKQIMVGLIVGVLLGWLKPDWAVETAFLRTIFLNLIKVIIAPLIFGSIVAGIAGGGSAKKVGRIGVKALVYFEVVTTMALLIGLVVVNTTKPGVGVALKGDMIQMGKIAENHPMNFVETIVHAFPSNIIDSMMRNDVLQIVAFSVIFAFAVSAMGKKGEPIIQLCDSLSQVMFKFTSYVMHLAPFGVGAAMAVTVGHMGIGVLVNLGMLVGTLYLALLVFVIGVFGTVAYIIKLPVKQFLRAVKEPFVLAFMTTSSESALPKAMEVMERIGVPKRIVGFVMPTGYSFNLDGSTLYLAVASVFVAQAAETTTGIHFGWGQQIMLMLTLMITSKGVAAVPRASLVVLFAALHSFGLPPEGVAVIFAVDELMDMARTSVNVLGNCLACVVVGRWEGEFDDNKARVFGTPEEVRLEAAEGNLAFAQDASRGE